MEYNNRGGGGAEAGKRVKWAKMLTVKDAGKYTLENVMKGSDNWNPLNK